jgi:D-erythro-7,8-dihydroneopterin triphosphate epimerase
MDRIVVHDLRVRCIIGVDDEERRERQDVLINLDIFTDLRKAGKSDRIEDALDYRALKKQIVRMTENSEYHLVEALAEAVADIFRENPLVRGVRVRVEKPGALRFARSVGVEITRMREKR